MSAIINIVFVYLFMGLFAKLIISPHESFANYVADKVIEKQIAKGEKTTTKSNS